MDEQVKIPAELALSAQQAIDSGAALAKLQELVAYSQKLGQAAA